VNTRIADIIRNRALALGFGRVGFCAAGQSPHGAYLDEWLAAGRHGTMDWLARNPQWRKDIRARYEWARSFILLAMDYAPELPQKLPVKSLIPRIARYARGRDYHDVYAPALKTLQEEVIALGGPGTQAMWYQDTGPFLERELAARAGLGWVGKNTMLIHPETGSWSFLALIVTSLELPPDTPGTDHCGTCTRCLEACPTDAFPAPYQMDATRCISYLTIEHKGPVAQDLREPLGDWFFGCDICNEVCPWNRPRADDRQAAAAPSEDLAGLTPARVLTGKSEHLQKRIAGTPLERAGESRLRRNAALNAGNRKDESLLPSLEQALREDDPEVQEAIIWALKRMGTRPARAALARAQRVVTDEALREHIIQSLKNP
jgi:epoxyqueuosine reductase